MNQTSERNQQNIFKLIKRLWNYLDKRRQRHFSFLLIGMILGAVSEVVTLGAILPFIGIMINPEKFFSNEYIQVFAQELGISSAHELITPITVVFFFLALTSGVLRVFLTWANAKLAFSSGSDLSTEVYRRTLHQPYRVHISRNSSEIVASIISKIDRVVLSILLPFLTMCTNFVIAIFVAISLVSLNPLIAFFATGGFAFMYWLISFLAKTTIRKNSICISEEQPKVVKALQEGLGGIRDVLLMNSQEIYCEVYKNADQPLKSAQGSNIFLGMSPRYIIESLAMLAIIIFTYSLSIEKDGLTQAIPMLSALVLGAQKLLPCMQQVYGAYTTISGNRDSLMDVLELLDQEVQDQNIIANPISFHHEIEFDNVSFRYDGSNADTIQSLSFKIQKGESVGIVGSTGSGKSTVLDLFMGLLQPTSGEIKVDSLSITAENLKSWQSKISHVPQSIYLSDNSFFENIAFGQQPREIDKKQAINAAKLALVTEFEKPENFLKPVGERGINLSGGQRQRIGIARAFYRKSEVLILDEATSALDDSTEDKIMNNIGSMDKSITTVMVAHRLSSLSNCDKIIVIEGGKLKEVISYKELIQKG